MDRRVEVTEKDVPSGSGAKVPAWLRGISAVSSKLNYAGMLIAAALIVMMTGLILVEIGMRFFSQSTYMTDVLVAYGVAAVTFIAAPWALEEGAMIRVTALTGRLRGRLRRAAEALVLLVSAGIFGFLINYQWNSVAKLWTRGSVSEHHLPIPLWIPEMILLTGLVLLFFQIVVRALHFAVVGLQEERTLKI